MKEITVSILEHIGSNAAVSSEDGEMLFHQIKKAIEHNIRIILDFQHLEFITPTFLNTAIGQLYSKYDSPFLRDHLKVKNIAKEDRELLKKVVERAKEYFQDKELTETRELQS